MSRHSSPLRIQHSLWERLTNPDLLRGEDVGVSASGEIERLKKEVCRDLEWLLNTRTAPLDIPEGLDELRRSLVRFGLPDFSSMNFGDPKVKERLANVLAAVIRDFEPRLVRDSVEVEFADEDQDKFRSRLHYRIRGKLRIDPVPQPVEFDTVLELTNKTFVVEGDGS